MATINITQSYLCLWILTRNLYVPLHCSFCSTADHQSDHSISGRWTRRCSHWMWCTFMTSLVLIIAPRRFMIHWWRHLNMLVNMRGLSWRVDRVWHVFYSVTSSFFCPILSSVVSRSILTFQSQLQRRFLRWSLWPPKIPLR